MRLRLSIGQYFGIEWINAGCLALFLLPCFFWARDKFGYSDVENLVLSAVSGVVSVFSSRYGGRLADRIGYDRMLRYCLAGLALTMLLGSLPTWRGTPFVVVTLYVIFMGPTSPALEAAILHSPGHTSVPERVGLWNITWSSANALGYFLGGALFTHHVDAILWVAGGFHLVLFVWLSVGRAPGSAEGVAAMQIPHRGAELPREAKKGFLHTAWLANGVAFVLQAGFFALAPQMQERLGLDSSRAIWLASTLNFTRMAGFFLFWRWKRWHYHMGWSQTALWMAPAALAVVFFVNQPLVIFGALAVFGVAVALSYSSSIYYSLDYAETKGELGGLHESFIGIGIFLGSLLASLAGRVGGGTEIAQITIVALSVTANIAGCLFIPGARGSVPVVAPIPPHAGRRPPG